MRFASRLSLFVFAAAAPLTAQTDRVVGHELSVSPTQTRLTLETADGERIVVSIGDGAIFLNSEPLFRFDSQPELATVLTDLLRTAAEGSSAELVDGIGPALEGLDLGAIIANALERVDVADLTTDNGGDQRRRGLSSVRTEAMAELAAAGVRVEGAMVHDGDLTVRRADRIDGDVVVLRGDASVYGHITGDLIAFHGDVMIHRSGRVAGDVITINGEVSRADGAIGGSVRSRWSGEAPQRDITVSFVNPIGSISLVSVLAAFVALLGIGFGMMHFLPEPLDILSSTVTDASGKSFLAGAFSIPLLPVALVVGIVGLALTVVGVLLIPLAILAAIVAVGLVAGAGYLACASALGDRFLRRQAARGVVVRVTPFRSLATGIALLISVWIPAAMLDWVPVVGAAAMILAGGATLVALTTGFGATVLSRHALKESLLRYRRTNVTGEYKILPTV